MYFNFYQYIVLIFLSNNSESVEYFLLGRYYFIDIDEPTEKRDGNASKKTNKHGPTTNTKKEPSKGTKKNLIRPFFLLHVLSV